MGRRQPPRDQLWMELTSADVLASFMEYRELSVRGLAAQTGLAPAVIGHLRCGRRKACTTGTARAIEKALHAPPGVLFRPRVLIRSRAA